MVLRPFRQRRTPPSLSILPLRRLYRHGMSSSRRRYQGRPPSSTDCRFSRRSVAEELAMPPRTSAATDGSRGGKKPSRQSKDELSTGLWLLKHTQGIVTTATAIGILHLRTAHVLYFTVGSLVTSFTAKGLKRVIKQPRPPGSRVKKTSGMPSTHSA